MDASLTPIHPGGVRAWLLAARLPTLPAAVTPVLVGSAVAVAQGHFQPAVFAAALATSLLLQIGANLANDYFDYGKGADTAARLGPVRVTQSGLIPPAAVHRATVATFGLAVLTGLYLVAVGGWPILLAGLLAIAAAVLYTGGPWPFGYHGLGELFVFVFFGLVAVIGTAHLHTGAIGSLALAAAVPVGLLATAILVVNNLRDLDTDRAAGKHTLAVRLGRQGTRFEYLLLLTGAYAVPPGLWLAGAVSPWVWLPWLTLPLAVPLARLVASQEGRALNAALKGTARLHLLFGLLFAASLLL